MAVSALRSGLTQSYLVSDTEYVWGFEGPFEVDDLDAAILQAIADSCEGHDEGGDSDFEPNIVRGRLIRTTARDVAEYARTLPVPRRPRA